MNSKGEQSLSKLLSLMLRHAPQDFGLRLDPEDGSCELEDLLTAVRCSRGQSQTTAEDIREVVRRSDKQRFEIHGAAPAERIRARYGHSFGKLAYDAGMPPAALYHGTNLHALPKILEQGLLPMGRKYVHLSGDTHFAELAGKRRGKLVMLRIDTAAAARQGIVFYDAGHDVWLAERVPPQVLAVDETYGINS
ncbi:RNA 2'-phosphotransferase [Paenibacillus donghaensis]|uniref:Probable RNA 2'-phosphotransferase n=1 Tax=Paenibacillus donghaensis TaxID=414771 RepID=A0A2Z2KRW4_9BACL|nr:RNA 2'-phosphotransferase [Paenibacillus donghaensis]ASA24252.1 RNA 2'-phosphotransferase [Paenibacillus donghaensis]